MTIIRKIAHVVMLALSLQMSPVFASNVSVQSANFWDKVSGWFSHHVDQAEKVADKMGDKVEKATKRVGKRVRNAANKAKNAVKAQAGGMADRIVEPMVERAGEHVKRHMEPVIKKGLQHVERHAEPMLARTEKRIHQNIARTVRAYCFAGLGGIVAVFAARQLATGMISPDSGAAGRWLHKHNEGSSALVADVMIGAMVGMGIYGLTQVDTGEDEVPAKSRAKARVKARVK